MRDRSILVRNVPIEVHSWIEHRRHDAIMTQNEFLLALLQKERGGEDQLTLFSQAPRPERIPGSLPFVFSDLFSGIGGMRLGLERVGGRCVFSCEWDRYAQKTYKAWFGEMPKGDIRKIKPADIPDHDVLAAGFPCQPFSIAGVSKKKSLGHAHGFLDVTQGTLFFYLATIIQLKRPPVLLLENVKNLLSHDKGRTWEVIKTTLEDLDYKIFKTVIDAASWVPQHRERVFIVGFDKKMFGDTPPFSFPPVPEKGPPSLEEILEAEPDAKYTLTTHLWSYLQAYAARHREKGNGFGFGLADRQGVTRTLSARYFKDGSEILIPRGKGRNPRRLTPKECARLMGFTDMVAASVGLSDGFPIVVSDTQAYRQFGNAVVPAAVEAVARQIVKVLAWQLQRAGCLVKRPSAAAATRSAEAP